MGKIKTAYETYEIVKSRNTVKKEKNGKKFILTVKAKDLPEGISKDDLVAAFKMSAEIKEEETKAPAEEPKTSDEKKKRKFNPKYLIPILLPIALIGAVKGCSGQEPSIQDIPIEPIIIEEQVEFQHYDIESPYVDLEATTNAKGQEGMTANTIDGESSMDGAHYNSKEQFADEERSSVGQEAFEQMEEEAKKCIETLTNSEATQAEKKAAAERLLEIDEEIEAIYKENLEFIEKQGADFEENARAHEDSHTDEEIRVIRATIDEYKENLDLSSENVEAIRKIVDLINKGYDIDVIGQEMARGDYKISGEAVKEVAQEEGLDKGMEETLYKLMDGSVKDGPEQSIGE